MTALSVNPYLLPVEEVVNKLACDSEERGRYQTYEQELRSNNKAWDSYPFSGGINWGMSPQEITDYVLRKFQELRQTGVLLFKSEFKEKYEGIKFRAVGADKAAKYDLTRLWGTEYLNNAFETMMSKKPHLYRVPRTVLIMKDKVTQLKVWINETPAALTGLPQLCISWIDHAEIQSEFIEGTGCAQEGLEICHKKLLKLGYSDDASNNNIIRATGTTQEQEVDTMYVVDTEAKSFGYFDSKTDIDMSLYAEERFKKFSRSFLYRPILIPISK